MCGTNLRALAEERESGVRTVARTEKTICIHAPIGKAFSRWDDPTHPLEV
jgi:hypothetical protein